MRRSFWLVTGVCLGGVLLDLGSAASGAQAQTALSGQVSSREEGAMEGVLVSAKREGSTTTVTVVTDEQGRYAFPAAKLEPGRYAIAIRAVGYKLDGPKTVEVAAQGTATADLKLGKVKNVASQLSNGEWLLSLPGEDKQKAFLTQCVGCHTLQRVVMSPHDAEAFQQIFLRMARYSPGSSPTHPQPLLPGPRGERPVVTGAAAVAAAQYLAGVNMSNAETLEFPLKTLPRPKGRATKVVITEYDLPRKDAMPHDVIIDRDGQAWYSDFGAQFVGVMDPKTGAVKDIPIPVLKPEQPKGGLDLEFDADGNIWLSMMYQAGITKIDRKTHEVKAYPFPKEWQSNSTQASMVSPAHADIDGKVWTNNQEDHLTYRLDVATGTFENMGQNKDASGKQIRAYGMPTDHQNNVYQLEFGGTSIGRRDAKTGEVKIWPTPRPGTRPRRGRVDEQNRLWFAEYGANGIGMFDHSTGIIKEWMLPTPWSAPYDVVKTKSGEIWTGSMLNDQVARLDPKTDEIVEYLLPRTTNIRRVFVDDSGDRPVFWVGSNHGASIIKLEPLD
ncbi:MAG TPA: carboxypeptidase regulatory-like domain-containing protein [Xanthobacteraceae bacterium]|nr:carboxypeptidase regulatory-like domain-containing protein [Xanthobacteraceae bacterium]